MENSNKQICRLCLEMAPSYQCEPIDEIKKEILQDLQIFMDFGKCDYAVACNGCLGKVQDCFEFKSQVTALAEGDFKVDIKKICQREMSQENSYLENPGACRLCTSLVENKVANCTTGLKDMIRDCFPEVDLNTIHEPSICKLCLKSLKRYYEFMKSCQRVEQRIKRYCQLVGFGTTCRVILKDMLRFKDCDKPGTSPIIKKECLDVQNVDMIKALKNDEGATIKCEEIDIKGELGDGAGMSESDQLHSYNSLEMNDSAEQMEIDKCETEGKEHSCPKCTFTSKRTYDMINHMRYHFVFKCFLCPFTADTDLSLKAHMTSHRGPSKAFGCRECPFEADRKYNLLRHLLKHRDKCAEDKSKVTLHIPRKAKATISKCQECPFTTKYKYSFTLHQLKHTNPEKIRKHKCETCDYETIYKANLRRHRRMHEDPELANKFQCGRCPYRTKWPGDLKRHMASHYRQRPYRYRIPVSERVKSKPNIKMATI